VTDAVTDGAVDVLTIEVGSTITKVNGFVEAVGGGFAHVAQGFAPTSVADGDVGIGVDAARADLESRYAGSIGSPDVFVSSSAAGGLRMTVHGLTPSMTTRAAREGSLGAGAVVVMVTAGELEDLDLAQIRRLRPTIVLLAGGVDHGEKVVTWRNAQRLAGLGLDAPVVYAGNVALRGAVTELFASAGVELLTVDNVFPEVDVLVVEPLRRRIHEVFNARIVHAPGMARLGDLTSYEIIPTPGAVLRGAELFAEAVGDCLVVDVGGATTDVHSVTDGSPEYQGALVDPEPRAKRTVEGDLGVYVNAAHVVALDGGQEWAARMGDLVAMPASQREVELTRWLCARAVEVAVRRHAAVVSTAYTPSGKKVLVRGKDLSAVRWVVATGGALTKVPGADAALRAVCTGAGHYLLPPPDARVLLDRDYLFSALGSMATVHPGQVRATFARWVREVTQ
jgi:uncharacterized protein (TIGR01319 family)